jgi:lipid-A-disaccharide synthase
VALLLPLFLQAAQQCLTEIPELHFLLPAASTARLGQLEMLLAGTQLPITLLEGRSHEVMGASDAVLMASGTTTLEAMLLKKPMVVTYKMAPLSYAIISRLLKTPYVSLPNLLANKPLVPELIQQAATVEAISAALLKALRDDTGNRDLQEQYRNLHQQLRCHAGDRAAQTVLDVAGERS